MNRINMEKKPGASEKGGEKLPKGSGTWQGGGDCGKPTRLRYYGNSARGDIYQPRKRTYVSPGGDAESIHLLKNRQRGDAGGT